MFDNGMIEKTSLKANVKKCPFCGERVELNYVSSYQVSWYEIHHVCKSGILISITGKSEREVVAKWNERKLW